jgi:hypothetical protein
MKHLFFAAFVLFLAIDALACSNLPRLEQRRKDQADIAEQAEMVQEMARAAEAVYVARAVWVSDLRDKASFEVLRTLKGETPEGQTVQFDLADELIVGCTASAGFKNVYANAGGEYLLYVIEGTLARTGDLRREYPEISFREELRQIRKALVPNKTMEPTR